jgi:hypothetical protein
MQRENPLEMSDAERFSPRRAERAAQQAVREAVLRHKKLGQSVVVWRDGKVLWIPAEDIELGNEKGDGAA